MSQHRKANLHDDDDDDDDDVVVVVNGDDDSPDLSSSDHLYLVEPKKEALRQRRWRHWTFQISEGQRT